MIIRSSVTKMASRISAALFAAVVLAVLAVLLAPSPAAQAASAACTAPGDLYASAGTATYGGQTVKVWGYNTTGTAVTRPGGPTLCVTVGQSVTITLHNGLTENTALLFQGQPLVPDRVGAAPAGTKSYTFTAGHAGTYLYEAGLVPNGQHQVAMGLYGALIVRPAAAGQAYPAADTAFDDEAVLVLGEIDPALNNAADPAAFDMRNYAPRYALINGRAFPDTEPIAATAPGSRVLLRYVNAGIQYHSLASLGADQRIIALDGSPLDFSRNYVAETFGPGQTADAIVTAPPGIAALNRLAIYDGSLLLHSSNAVGAGGMLTFLTVPAIAGGPDVIGPVTSSVAYAAGTLQATVDDTTTGGGAIAGAVYYIDTVSGAGQTMTGSGTGSVHVTASVTVPSGEHVVYVRGRDSAGNWGGLSSVLTNGGDATGPSTKSPTLTPGLSNGTGTAGVTVHATADDSASGGSNITAAEAFIGTVGANGSGTPLAVNAASPVASVDGTFLPAVVNALTEGTHVVSIHSRDAALNWGAPVTINLVIDKTPPSTSGVSAAPSPNNGTLALNPSTPAVRVTISTMSDPISAAVNSSIRSAEGFIDTVGANGTGIGVNATDGSYNSASEAGYIDIPLATVAGLSDGVHTISVHAKDAAGNWGAMATTTLLVDKGKPVISGVTATPNPTLSADTVNLTAQATDALTTVNRAEWFTGTDPGLGNATPMAITGTGPWTLSANAINIANWNEGAYTLTVRARDAAGNWSANTTTVLQVRRPLSFSTAGSSNPPGVTGTADDADIYNWNGTAFSRTIDVTTAPYSLPGGANVDGFDRASATTFYLSFTDQVNLPGLTNVQDEDVVFFNGTTWSLFFDGSAHGLGNNNNLDLDAISITGTTLYFSTLGNTNPPLVGGTADDADIYSWNGAVYARVIDASAAPYTLPTNANTDGFVRIDASHFYLSFSATTTTVPVLGTVQDEDIIYNNAGTWSTYFDGTTHALTTNNLDIDAFDIP